MRLHRFFIEEQLRNKKEFTLYDDEVIHQWKDVFRLRAGSQIILLDNSGYEYLAEITLLAKGQSEVKILQTTLSENIPDKNVTLFAALIKKDNYEWILEKCTEIGVSHFVPVVSERTEKKDLNRERAQKIIKEASEQSERGMMPTLDEVSNLKDALEKAEAENISLIAFHSDSEYPDLKKFAPEVKEKLFTDKFSSEKKHVGILVGPEGGWSPKEIELFVSKNIPLYSLGKQVLRAETAAIVIAGLLLM